MNMKRASVRRCKSMLKRKRRVGRPRSATSARLKKCRKLTKAGKVKRAVRRRRRSARAKCKSLLGRKRRVGRPRKAASARLKKCRSLLGKGRKSKRGRKGRRSLASMVAALKRTVCKK